MPSRKKPTPAVLSDFTRQQAAVYLNIGLYPSRMVFSESEVP
jgi:hypothetical protein